ncbi:MAG: alpha/beta hydrolase-fold protein [Verrucomicrobiales bacterium]|nr:alpha/beta hydrolase-fold protein [Verrucomicrobiales bacterium]
MIHERTIDSAILGCKTSFLIVTPEPKSQPLPAVLLLRGKPQEWLKPHEDSSRRGRNLLSVYQDLREKGYCKELAFILPQTCNDSGSNFISHGEALHPELIEDKSQIGNGRIDAFLDEELIPHCAQSPLIDTEHLSIDGFSLGGSSAIYHALRRPELFKSCASFDGSFLDFDFDNPLVTPETPSDLRFDFFPYLFGFPPNEKIFRKQNPIDMAKAGLGKHLPPAMIHFSNNQSPESNGWRVQRFLQEAQIQNHAPRPDLDEASDHQWWWVDEHLYRSLPFHSHFLYSSLSQSQ